MWHHAIEFKWKSFENKNKVLWYCCTVLSDSLHVTWFVSENLCIYVGGWFVHIYEIVILCRAVTLFSCSWWGVSVLHVYMLVKWTWKVKRIHVWIMQSKMFTSIEALSTYIFNYLPVASFRHLYLRINIKVRIYLHVKAMYFKRFATYFEVLFLN